eukprot:SAG31_NODE_26101_length_448_cov_0.985673_2_plen_53_part_01
MTEEMIASLGSESPSKALVKKMLLQLREQPPDVLRLQVEGAGGKGVMMNEEHL